jgi:hypothetical protein
MQWETALQQHDRWLRTVVFSRVGEARLHRARKRLREELTTIEKPDQRQEP